MKKSLTTMLVFVVVVISLSSCVAKRKYVSAKNRAEQQQKDIAMLNNRNAHLTDSINNMSSAIQELRGRIGELGYENEQTSTKLNMTKEQFASQQKRMKQLQDLMAQQQRNTQSLKRKMADALTGFNTNELTVEMKNGKVYISMQESLLFQSGSAKVNPKGKQALAQVASVLNANNDINIEIEGHTDSIAIHNNMYADNWALSVSRATSIAHVLIDEYKVSPARLVASGRSHYDPIADNTNPRGRALNRRTEIILEPKLDELMMLMNTDNVAGR